MSKSLNNVELAILKEQVEDIERLTLELQEMAEGDHAMYVKLQRIYSSNNVIKTALEE